MCTSLRQIAAPAAPPYKVTVYRFGENQNYQVAQYSEKSMALLEEKLGQFPQGTAFTLIPSSPETGDQTTFEQEAAAVFAKHGMKLAAASQ